MHDQHSRTARASLLLLLLSLAVAAAIASAQPVRRTGWAELSALAPGSPIVVRLVDGRHLDRVFVRTTAAQLVTLNLSAVSSRDRRDAIVAQARLAPDVVQTTWYVEDDGRVITVVQPFDRGAILAVERPRPPAWQLPKVVSWMLEGDGPCPNCDPAQTSAGRKPTTLFSPLPADRQHDVRTGEPIYLARTATPNPLDQMAWDQLRALLPSGLQAK